MDVKHVIMTVLVTVAKLDFLKMMKIVVVLNVQQIHLQLLVLFQVVQLVVLESLLLRALILASVNFFFNNNFNQYLDCIANCDQCPNSSTCNDCAAGYEKITGDTCSPCAAMTFAAESGTNVCDNCPPKTFSGTAASSCKGISNLLLTNFSLILI